MIFPMVFPTSARPFLTATAALAVSLAPVSAETDATVPAGVLTIEIAPGSPAAPAVTTFSLPLRGSVPDDFVGQSAGWITSVTANSITSAGANWSPGALSQAGSPYFLRITSGPAAGRTLQIAQSPPNTEDTVTVLNQGTNLDALGISEGAPDTFEIFPGDTLASFFGTSTLGGTSAATADGVRLHNGSTWSEYFFHAPSSQWRLGSVPVSQNHVVLRPDAGITFYRRGNTPLAYALVGVVPSTPIRSVVNNGGVTYLGNPFPVTQTLAGSGFNQLPGWVSNTGSVTAADKVAVWNGSSYTYYNFNQAAGQWRAGSVPVNQNAVSIAPGVPVLIERPTAAGGIDTLVRDLPYTLNP